MAAILFISFILKAIFFVSKSLVPEWLIFINFIQIILSGTENIKTMLNLKLQVVYHATADDDDDGIDRPVPER